VTAFVNLDALYRHLEERAMEYESLSHIHGLFLNHFLCKFFYSRSERADLREAERTHWETAFFGVELDTRLVVTTVTRLNGEGEVITYPDLDSLDDAALRYLAKRVDDTDNPLLKAHYAHLLWRSPVRKPRHGRVAVDSYLELVKIYERRSQGSPGKAYGTLALRALESAREIAEQVDHRITRIDREMIRLIHELSEEDTSSCGVKADLIRAMLRKPERFTAEDYEGIQQVCWRVARWLSGRGRLGEAVDMLELGRRVDERVGVKTHRWGRRVNEYLKVLETQKKNPVD
jgi:hypothetical protein